MMRKLFIGTLALLMGVSGLWAFTAGTSSAATGAKLTLSRYAPFERDYTAASSDSRGVAYKFDPQQCAQLPFCMTIPLHIDPPIDVARGDDWFAVITLSWVPRTSNLDLYLYDNTQLKTENPPAPGSADSTSNYSAIGSPGTSSSATKPSETMTLTRSQLGDIKDFNLVVETVTGATAFHMSGKITVAKFVAPFESIEQPLEAPPTSGGSDVFPVLEPTPEATPTTDFGGPAAPTLDPLGAPADDADLAALGTKKQSALGVVQPDGSVQPLRTSSQRSPSGPTLLLWLVVVPALLIGLPTGLLARRRQTITWS